MANNQFIARRGIISLDDSQITGSLSVTNSVTASFFTGSYRGDGSQLTGIEGFPFTGSAGITGSLTVVGPVNATTFTGDGSQLTGIEGFPFTGSAKITGSLEVTGSVSATSFIGNGSQLTGIDGFPFTGSAAISGSLTVVGPVNATSFTGSIRGTATTASYVQLANVDGFTAYSASINTTITPQTATVNTGSSPLTLTTQSIVIADSTNGNLIVNLPDLNTVVGTPNQKPIVVYKNDYSQNVIYVNPSGSQLVNGASQDIIVSIQLAVIYNPTSAGWVTEGTSAQSLAELELFFVPRTETGSFATTGSNQFSGSQTITGSLTVTGTITGNITGSASTASYVEYANVANKPAIVSGSSQISFNGITDKPTLVSGSSQITYSGLTGIPSGILSGSAQIASFGIFATTGSNQFNGNQSITGSLTVSGQVVAQTLNVQQVTSSIVYSSGSNIFGNTLGNTQQFTGSVSVTGSFVVTTTGTELQVTNTGVNLGNIVTDNHNVTGSLIASGSLGVTGSLNVNGQSIFYQPLTTSTSYLTVQNNRARNAAIQTTTTNGSFLAGTSIGTDTFNYQIYDGVAGSARLTISSTGEVTFSSSVTANGNSNTFGNASLSGRAVIIQAGSTNQAIMFKNSAGGDGTLFINGTSTTVDYNFNTYSVADALVIKNNGSIGINTSTITNPNSLNRVLQISAAAPVGVVLFDSRDANPIGLENRGAVFYLTYNTSNILVADGASGKVSIGTTTPLTNLTIEGTNRAFPLLYNTGYGNLHIQSNETTATQNFGGSLTFGGLGRTSGPTEKFIWAAITGRKETTSGGDPKGYLQFGTCDDITNEIKERMRITSGGNVGIGTTDLTSTRLRIKSTTTGSSNFVLYTEDSSANILFWVRDDGVINTGTRSGSPYNNTSANVANLYVSSGGTLERGTASSKRFKENIINWDGKGLETILALKPSTFTYKESYYKHPERVMLGLIAEEVAEVCPYLADYENEDGSGQVENVRYANIVVPLIKSIQEQQSQIEILKAEIQTLKQ